MAQNAFGSVSACDVKYQSEQRRLASFKEWPGENETKCTKLAKHGFFYTGNKDEVQCFSCAVRIRGWDRNDCPLDVHRRQSPNCNFINHRESGNQPLFYNNCWVDAICNGDPFPKLSPVIQQNSSGTYYGTPPGELLSRDTDVVTTIESNNCIPEDISNDNYCETNATIPVPTGLQFTPNEQISKYPCFLQSSNQSIGVDRNTSAPTVAKLKPTPTQHNDGTLRSRSGENHLPYGLDFGNGQAKEIPGIAHVEKHTPCEEVHPPYYPPRDSHQGILDSSNSDENGSGSDVAECNLPGVKK
ncbi:E3 ubiquitin-protein ligase XIAP-like isoform X2 [Lingula anatina]|uniref:E3 ubiquitin-protein ligase XIAP-like isoform X2 n=1 Tax=Lingula anatina TaxID=7574 RepID=A0A1S3IKC6_LINAN|nr:E3 ubiquitin-protein ligase XIAP-like isoform X2 [Lingula anatina]|eukprot:XP_013398662.1 E3 ubiquitin-protein ligase XIAP-like isoform X2 [Lingula anatina]